MYKEFSELKNKRQITQLENRGRILNNFMKKSLTSLVKRQMQIKTTSYPLGWLLSNKQIIMSVGEGVDKLEPSSTALENYLAVPQSKHRVTQQFHSYIYSRGLHLSPFCAA